MISYLSNKKFRGVGDINIKKKFQKNGFSFPSIRVGDMIMEQQMIVFNLNNHQFVWPFYYQNLNQLCKKEEIIFKIIFE